MSLPFARALEVLARGERLSPADVERAFASIFAGEWTSAQVAALAIALRIQGEDADTIVAAARALRSAMHAVEIDRAVIADTCGTGGDGRHTLNVSTAAAVVVAACGVTVAKHGNRSVSSKCGSADVVEALGVPIDVPPARQAEVIKSAGITFLMAPAHHPALKHAAQARRELGVRTIFNALGPLVNPARANHQLVGVYDESLRPVLARALATLGSARAWVVRSEDGLDEISPAASTRVSVVAGGAVTERTVSPEDFGLSRGSLDAIAGSDAETNARTLATILEGGAHPGVDTVVLNAAATLHVAGVSEDLRECAGRAREALASGAAKRTLVRWREAAQREKAS